MNIAYIDDEIKQRNINIPIFMDAFSKCDISIHRFDFFSSSLEFLNEYKDGNYDLIILDIIMDQINGIDLASKIKEINKDTKIIFCSSSNEFVSESYDVDALYYLQKPIDEESVLKMIKKLEVKDFELNRFIILPNNQKLILRNVIYSEYSNHVIIIQLKTLRTIRLWLSQNKFEDLLKNYPYFVAINSGNLINMYEVKSYNGESFTMSDNTVLFISRRRKKEVKEIYDEFLISIAKKEA